MLFSAKAHCSGRLSRVKTCFAASNAAFASGSRLGVVGEIADVEQAGAEPVLRVRPVDRRVVARQHLERGAPRGDRLLPASRRASLIARQRLQRRAEIGLRQRPLPAAIASRRVFLERLAIGFDRLLQQRRIVLELAGQLQRVAEVVVRHRVVERHPRFACIPASRRGRRPPTASSLATSLLRWPSSQQHRAEIVLSRRPVERRQLAREDGERIA